MAKAEEGGLCRQLKSPTPLQAYVEKSPPKNQTYFTDMHKMIRKFLAEYGDALDLQMDAEFHLSSTTRRRTILYQIDVDELFGKPPYYRKVNIRTSGQIKRGEDIKLPQFDPNFFSPHQSPCRFPHCLERKARSSNHSLKMNKEDLYMCRSHRQEINDLISKQCFDKGINVSYKDFKDEDFHGYTSLIGLMEETFQHLERKATRALFPSKMDLLLAEIFLNIRNFLIITNLLLNPDHENRRNVLIPITTILQSMLERCDDREYVENTVYLLRQVMQTILSPFGVVYTWVSLPLQGNPGAQIGAGIGGILGATGVAVFGRENRFGQSIIEGAGIGFLCGGLLGGGMFNLREHYQRERNLHGYNQHRNYMSTNTNTYVIRGTSDGGLSIVPRQDGI